MEGLDNKLQWPAAMRGQKIANVYPGKFHGCVGITDVRNIIYHDMKFKDAV